jgi:hypothetical protein
LVGIYTGRLGAALEGTALARLPLDTLAEVVAPVAQRALRAGLREAEYGQSGILDQIPGADSFHLAIIFSFKRTKDGREMGGGTMGCSPHT